MVYPRFALESELIDPANRPAEDEVSQAIAGHLDAFEQGTADLVATQNEREEQRALEERSDGKAEKEKEHTIYARVADFAFLAKSTSMEMEEQWEIRIAKTDKNFGKGSMRVRKTWVEGGTPSFTRVTKIPTKEADSKIEIPLPSNEEEFMAFMYLAEQGMRKDRYHFPVLGTDLVWEFDCFPKGDGTYHEWIKIDLEVDDLDAPLPQFPISLAEVILPKRFKKLSEEEWDQKVTALYEQFFLSKNKFVTGEFQQELQAEAEQEKKLATGTEPQRGDKPVPKDDQSGGKPEGSNDDESEEKEEQTEDES